MATSVTQSLFGITPESIMQERSAAANRQALDFARLDPFEAARYGLFRGASQLGEGLTSAMGYEDPEIARAKARQGMLSGVNMNDPESLLAKAQSLQATDPMAAQSLVAQAQDMQGALVKQNKIKYDMEQEQAAYQNRFRALKAKFPQISDEEAQGIAGSRESFDKLIALPKTDTKVVETVDGQLLINNQTGEVITNLGRAPDRRNVTNVDARSFSSAETEYGKVVGKDSATRDVNLIDAAEGAAKNLPKMYETRALIEKGDINTGLARSVQDVVSQAQSKFLADKKAGKNVSDSEYLDSLLGSDVFPQIAALGIGAKGLDTVAERKFLQEVITGSRDLSRDTLLRMVDFRIGASEKAVDTYNERLGKGEFKKYQDTTGRTLKKAEKPKTTTKLRFNPATGRLEPI